MVSIRDMNDDDRFMTLMEQDADREQSIREGVWEDVMEWSGDAGADLAAVERDREEEYRGEHRMNCSDPSCLDRDDSDREAQITREYEELQDRIEANLEEYHRQVRLRNVRTLSRGGYRVELSGRRDTDPVNLYITPNDRDPEGFKFGVAGEYGTLGRVTGRGQVYLWPNVDNTERVRRVMLAMDVLLGAEIPGKYGKAYSRAMGICYRCGLPLSKEDSIDRMTGPVCAKKIASGER